MLFSGCSCPAAVTRHFDLLGARLTDRDPCYLCGISRGSHADNLRVGAVHRRLHRRRTPRRTLPWNVTAICVLLVTSPVTTRRYVTAIRPRDVSRINHELVFLCASNFGYSCMHPFWI